jgi:hypothetical protein
MRAVVIGVGDVATGIAIEVQEATPFVASIVRVRRIEDWWGRPTPRLMYRQRAL